MLFDAHISNFQHSRNWHQNFSVLDANSRFWAIKLNEASPTYVRSAHLLATTNLRGYCLNCAPDDFRARVKQLLENFEGVESFIDDIICWGRTKQERDKRLNALLERASSSNKKFNK